MVHPAPGFAPAVPLEAGPRQTGWHRWVICGLLFAATVLNYIDRQAIGFLQPAMSAEFGWKPEDYADAVKWFMIAYAAGYFLFGRLIDSIGAKFGYSVAVGIWTAAQLSCAFVGSLTGFKVVQVVLGFGQAGNFPAALRAVAEWFPQKERALANGIFNAGTNVGAIITPVIVPVVMMFFGWRAAFLITAALSIVWFVLWLVIYRHPAASRSVTPEELAYIRGGQEPSQPPISWLKLLAYRETWAFALGKFLTDPVWLFYLFWLPTYFVNIYHLKVEIIAAPMVVIYLISDFGSIAGGWMSSTMMAKGATANMARKLTMLLCACCVVPVAFATLYVHDLWTVTIVIGIATAAHQAFSANLYTLPSDTFPTNMVGTVAGIGGTAGAIGGILMSIGVHEALRLTNTYTPIFIAAGGIYFLAVIVIHRLTPRLSMAKLS